LPGKAKVYVKTWGCGHNNSDSEYMAGLLASHGYTILLESSKAISADLWLLNSCTVKGPSEQTFMNEIQRGLDQGKKIVVAGCVPQSSSDKDRWKGLSVIGVQQIEHVVEVVEETLQGNSVKILAEKKDVTDGKKRKAGGARLDLPKVRRNPWIEIVPINTGCLNQCTYCKTKHARGALGSYMPEEIVSRIHHVLGEGVKEIWLTSEDTGAYGHDIGVLLPDLLKQIVECMEAHPTNSDAMLRIGMTNPPYILDHISAICDILKHPRVYAFLHVPVQSGSTKVLEEMRRMYSRSDFEYIADILLEQVPGVTVATDIICGYPTESTEDWAQTMSLIAQYKFPVVHISQFYPRPGTPAARLQRLPTQVVKERSRELTQLFESYTTYDDMLGTRHKILVTEKNKEGRAVGHTKGFIQVVIEGDETNADEMMGTWVTVEISRVGKW
ncbi:hypothetical protein BC832DRAFT_518528, partial [Gaertneriomyces semiglobifer]